MDFPYGHHHHHHRRNEGEDEDGDYPRPPPPGAGAPFPPPPNFEPYGQPPSNFEPYGHPPPNFGSYDQSSPSPPRPPYSVYEPPPPRPPHPAQIISSHHNSYSEHDRPNYPPTGYAQHASHVSYEAPPHSENSPESEHQHHDRPHMPAFIGSHFHEHGHQSSGSDILANKPTFRVFTKAEPNHSLAIRDGQVILARSDSDDPTHHWIKDEKYSIRVKDEKGFPSFSLINKATGQAVKHSIGATQPVRLAAYEPDKLDITVLWTLSNDLGDGYRTIRMVDNVKLNVDAYMGDEKGVHDGTTIVLWEWNKGDNQRWKIVPY